MTTWKQPPAGLQMRSEVLEPPLPPVAPPPPPPPAPEPQPAGQPDTLRTLPEGVPAVQSRLAVFDRASINSDRRTVQLAFSSETPVERYWGTEILGHDADEIDRAFIGGGTAPLLMDHNARDQIGVVESVTFSRTDRVGRAVVRFGKSARAEEIMRDVADGIRCNVSVGYELLELRLIAEAKDKPPTYRCRWRPREVSLVSIPADSTVGVGRDGAPPVPLPVPPIPAEAKRMDPVTDPNKPAAPPLPPTAEQINAAAQKRTGEILELAELANARDKAFDAIKRGISIEAFRGELIAARGEEQPLVTPHTQIGLSAKETRNFSLARFLVARAENNPTLAPFEIEASIAAGNASRAAGVPSKGGATLPYEVMAASVPGVRMEAGRAVVGHGSMQRDLGTATLPAGGSLVQTEVLASSFIELLRNAMQVRAMGATVLSGLVGNVAIPRQTGAAVANWVGQGAAAAESDMVMAQVSLTPKTVHAIQDYTRELLLQGSLDVEGLVRSDLAAVVALAIDFAALHGTVAPSQPTGLANTSGIGSEAGGANGAAPTWDNIVNLESLVAVQNAAVERLGYLTNSKVRGRLKRQPIVAGQPVFTWGGMPGAERADETFGTMNGYRAGVTQQVSSTLTKGTSTGVASAIFFGNWRDLLIGEWGALELLTDNITQAANRVIRVHAYQTCDVAVRRPQSFSAMLDALTT